MTEIKILGYAEIQDNAAEVVNENKRFEEIILQRIEAIESCV